MASIRKRKGKYQVQVIIRGKGTSATFQTLDLVRRWARSKELEFEKNMKVVLQYHLKTIQEILVKYKDTLIPHKRSASLMGFLSM